MTILSYSTIDNYLKCGHTYLNKVMGIEIPTNKYMEDGKVAHQVIQDHCLGKKKDERLKDLTWEFTTKEYHAKKNFNEKFTLHGYLDMVDFKSKTMCEIKTSKTPWSQQRFEDLIQWRYYAMVTGLVKVLFITCHSDLTGLKTFYREVQNEDIEKAREWAERGVSGIQAGEFSGGLDENRKCMGCTYGDNCYYK